MSITCAIPFQLDSTGAVQQVSNEDRALQDRVMALVSTVPGERLMRADYGVPTSAELFDPMIRDLVFTELKQLAAQAIRKWEPAAAVIDIKPLINQDQTTVAMDVRVGRADTPNREVNRSKRVLITASGDTFDASS